MKWDIDIYWKPGMVGSLSTELRDVTYATNLAWYSIQDGSLDYPRDSKTEMHIPLSNLVKIVSRKIEE